MLVLYLPFLLLNSSYSVFIQCFPLSRGGRIYPISSVIACTSSLHLSRLRVSSFFKPIFSLSSTCFQVFFGCPHFLLPLTSRSRATVKTLSLSLLSTCPYHLTQTWANYDPWARCGSQTLVETSMYSHTSVFEHFTVQTVRL